MSSVAKAGLASLAVLVIVGAGAFFLLNKRSGDAPIEVEKDADPAVARVAPPAEKTSDKKLMPHVPPAVGEVSFMVRVVDEATKQPLPQSSLLVLKATDGDRPGEKVFESGRRSGAGTGVFQVPVAPGVYHVRAQCPGFTSKGEKVTITKEQTPVVVLVLGKGNSVSGRVLTRDGHRPIGGAKVMAYPQIGNPKASMLERLIMIPQVTDNAQKPPQETVSADDGSYQIDGLERKYYTIKAVASGFTPSEKAEVLPTKDGVNLLLAPGGELSGTIVEGGSGTAVPGAKVNAFAHVESAGLFEIIEARSRPPFETVTSGPDGSFKFETLGAGMYNFTVTAKSYQQGKFLKVRVRDGQNPPQRFAVARGLGIAGRVVSASNEPVPGAKVRATRIGETGRSEQIFITFDDGSISSDADGHFTFDTLEPGKYTVLAWHRDHASEQRRDVDAGTSDLVITLPQGGAVEGAITEAGSGQAISGARISVSDMQDLRKEGISEESGHYLIAGLNVSGQGKRYMNIHAEGYARVSNIQVHVEEGKVTEGQNYELHKTATVTGRIVDSTGKGIAEARVMAKRKGPSAPNALTVGSAVTAEDGRYTMKDLEAGDETVISVLQTAGYLEGETASPFSVQPGQAVELPDLVLQVGGMVEGVVVGPDNRGVAGVQVTVRKENETMPDVALGATTEPSGKFILQGLRAGTVALVAKSLHHLEEEVEGVAVEEGRITRNVKIVLKQGSRVAGRVVDSGGQPVREAQVTARDTSQGLKELRGESDQDGNFSIDNILATEKVELEIEHPEYGSWASEVAVNTVDLKVVMPRLGGVRAQVVDPEGNLVPSFSVQPQPKDQISDAARRRLTPRTYQPKDGAFEYGGIPPGTYDIFVRAPSYSAHTFPAVQIEGQVIDLGRVVLREGGVISGSVRDTHSGRPLPGATVRVLGGLVKFNPGATRPAADASMVVTDAQGAFEFRNLKGGSISLQITVKGYVTKRVDDLDPNVAEKSRDLRIVLEQGAEIFGAVLDSQGNARNGVSVYLTGVGALINNSEVNQRTATNSEGRFQFQGLGSGTYRVTAQRLGEAGANPTVEVPIEAGFRQEVELVFE